MSGRIDVWFVHKVMICAHLIVHDFQGSALTPIVIILEF